MNNIRHLFWKRPLVYFHYIFVVVSSIFLFLLVSFSLCVLGVVGATDNLDRQASDLDRDAYSTPRQKRMRTSFKHHQLRTLKSYFALNHNPDTKDLKQLAQKTGLTKRVLQVRSSMSFCQMSLYSLVAHLISQHLNKDIHYFYTYGVFRDYFSSFLPFSEGGKEQIIG